YALLFGEVRGELPGGRRPRFGRLREESFERFRALGFPGPKVEEWRYTNLTPLTKVAFGLARPVEVDEAELASCLVAGAAHSRLVFVNGHLHPGLSRADRLPAGVTLESLAEVLERGGGDDEVAVLLPELEAGRGLSALNGAFTTGGAVLRVADGAELDRPVQLVFVSVGRDEPVMANPRNLVVLGQGSRASLIETHLALGGGEGRTLTNLVNRMVLGEGAELHHDRVQLGITAGTLIGKSEIELRDRARLTQTVATLGGGLTRNETWAVLDGSEIEVRLNGVYLTGDGQHIDNLIRMDHAKPNSFSDQFYKGVLDGRARAVFAGKVIVRRDAQKTNAYQANNNLLLSPDAEIDTKPELEIYADDVKCSHGATAGELDEQALFYLRSRGLDRATAQSLLTYAFMGEVIERFGSEEVASQVRREILERLPGGHALEEMP
ncbi:MAG TPA: Fe-S cluster assembly protein SufD, partial [Geminicoccaceae bacterium]|nr:Fe-S cluster assembly protein SufD [Geminicoccaceae bacterium]